MAPTIIVGDDEDAGEVAARLNELADHQRQVKVRTDLNGPAFIVPDELYTRYGGRRKRSDAERRVNAVDQMVADDDTPTQITSEDEIPDAARVTDPEQVDPSIAGPIEGDELPDAAKVIDPDPGDQGAATDGSPAEQANSDDNARTGGNPEPGSSAEQAAKKAAPAKRAARKSTPRKAAAKSTPAAAGAAE